MIEEEAVVVSEQKVGPDHMLCYVETAFMVGSVSGRFLQFNFTV